ncbi:MAG: efflux RND transporter permease subunit [Lachnospiraceae bacterium]|nr:efflux RND transporter permease subunit [Lachnospiraceae bacterium]
MSKFSVKKPYTILIAVLAVLILGVVSITKMQLDLLPEVNLPYLLVLTTYPGASPEKVESVVSQPLESSLGTITGVKNVTSYSYENYSMVQLEFEDDTNMDSVLVKVTSALNTVRAVFPEEVGTPNVLELSMDMLASMYVAISYEGKDMEQLSRFVEDTLVPEIERQEGVASVSPTGLIDKTIQVQLNQKKVDALNEKILAKAQEALDDAQKQLDDAKQQLEDSQAELDKGRNEMASGQADIDKGKAELEKGKEELEQQQAATYNQLAQASLALDQLSAHQTQLVSQQAQKEVLTAAIAQVNTLLATYNVTTDNLDSTIQTMENGINTANATITSLGGLITLADTIAPNGVYDEAVGSASNATIPAMSNLQFLATSVSTLAGTITDLSTVATSLNAAIAAYTADPTDATAIQNLGQAVAAASVALTATKTAMETTVSQTEAALPQLKTASQTVNSYKDELTALEVEIEVTKGIISKYEEELKKLGVSYTDIETAKMQAAAGFAAAQAQITTGQSALETAQAQLDAGKAQMDSAKEQIESGWDSYNDAAEQFEKQKQTALDSANAGQLLSLSTISTLIYAQNFEMPAGYIDDKDDNSWLLKIGNNYESVEELGNMLLTSIDGIGDITLDSVADITVIDNSDVTFARLNNESAVILSIFKASTTGTNEVSRTLRAEIDELEERYEGLDILIMVDQGDYIEIIIKSVMQSMILGAALAVIILAFFLKDVMPTIVVAISIPLSVLLSLVAMYFSGISLNMMSLSGMALGIGMLVDNSIVIIENIYRLRGRGINAPRAAVQGTNQVAGAVVASTLTSVCVFFPMVYTTGMVRSLMLPMALTIIYCLLASLLVAMTVVPAASSTMLKNTKPKEHKIFDKIQDAYGKVLAFCLKVKVVPLGIAILLLGISVWQVFRMGIVMIPEMTSNQIQGNITFDEEEITRSEAYDLMDELIYRTVEVEGIDSVGAMAGGDEALMGFGGTEGSYGSFSLMVTTENEKAGAAEVKEITDSITEIADELGINISLSSGLGEMGAILGSGLSISIYGQDLETLKNISEDVMEMVSQVDGYVDVSNGQEDADQVLHLVVDKDKAIRDGVTVAQIYQSVSEAMATTKNAITVTVDGVDMNVDIVDELDPVTMENLLDIKIPVTISETDEDTEEGEESEESEEESDESSKESEKQSSSGFGMAGGMTGMSTGMTGMSSGMAGMSSGMSAAGQAQETRPLSDYATLSFEDGYSAISRENQTRYITVTAGVREGENGTLLARDLQPILDKYEVPDGYTIDMGGESEATMKMVKDMMPIFLMGIAFIYFVMVAQFQSLLSPFIVLFTLPLAYTGGFISLWATGENISMMALMGFIVLTGTVVNNGIVYVDYANQLRIGGMERRDALIATGKTRMRPILMTALTTILAEASLIFGDDMGSQMGKAMALVIAGGLLYATLMTLFIIPVMYDILFKKPPLNVDVGGDNIDDIPDDAKEFMLQLEKERNEKLQLNEPIN